VRVRVVSFNVESFRAGLEPVRAALGELAPDVVLLQECRSGRAGVRLARALGMDGVTSHRPFNGVRNAVLFRGPWRMTEFEIRNLTRRERTLRRGVISAHLWRPGTRLTAVSVHLGLAGQERERHAIELTDLLSGLTVPVVVGADLNEAPTDPAARWISGRFFDGFAAVGVGSGATFPAGSPTARIDYLFMSDGVGIERVWVPDVAGASDHRPVAADIDVPGP
jgi:endonuclease/exonuclease/phosphatase family metal-dependent hydrolase